MPDLIQITLSYRGLEADESSIDLYDAGQALIGFHRSLAITTHFILNDEIITQSPSLKGARIFSTPPEEGSWKTTAIVMAIATGAYNLGTAPKDTPLGHLVRSAYDYVISEATGFHVDYDKTLGQQYKELKQSSTSVKLSQDRLDSVVEKCESAIREMHRPVVKSQTADQLIITASIDSLETRVSFLYRKRRAARAIFRKNIKLQYKHI